MTKKLTKKSIQGENLKRNVENIVFWVFLILFIVFALLGAQGRLPIEALLYLLAGFGFLVMVIYAWEQSYNTKLLEEHADTIVIDNYTEMSMGGEKIRLLGTSYTKIKELSQAEKDMVKKLGDSIKKELTYEKKMDERVKYG